MPRPVRFLAFVLLAAVGTVAGSCGRQQGRTERGEAGNGPRIVSLSPALTRSIERLGGGAAVVGCTPWCGLAGVPAVGSLEDRDLETIARLRPTLVVRQSDAADPGLEAVVAECGGTIASWRISSVAQAREAVEGLGDALERTGIAGARARAAAVLAEHRDAIGGPRVGSAPVVFLFSTDPPGAFGTGTYVDELWCALGGSNAVAASGYPALGAEDVLALRPAAVVVIGTAALPPWLEAGGLRAIALDAPELLEPGVDMLVRGPRSLRAAAPDPGGGR